MEGGSMNKRMLKIGAAIVVVGALAGGGIAWSTAADDDATDKPITGSALAKAKAAALAHTGGGSVTGTEVGDEESYYEVEVTLDDGSQVDVQLDEGFDVVGSEGDGRGDED
jgi:uncharacterized membrane protein YkoI